MGLDARYPCRLDDKHQHNCTMATAAWEYTEEKCFFKKSPAEQHSFSSIFNGLPLKIEIKPRM